MTNKQTHAAPEEKPSTELLLRRFRLMDEFVAEVRKKNIEAGLDPKYMGYYIQWREDTMERKSYLHWLSKVTNKKTGKFNQIADLKARELIPEDEITGHEGKEYPYRKLDSLIKVKTGDGKLYLMRHESWYGLDAAGQELNKSVNDLDYHPKIAVTYERIPKNLGDYEGPTIRVGKISTHAVYSAEQPGPKVYLNPYSKEKVDEYLRYAAGPIDHHRRGTSLILMKEGVANPCSATYEEFISDDFDGIVERKRTPPVNFDDFYKGWKKAKEAADKANVDSYQ